MYKVEFVIFNSKMAPFSILVSGIYIHLHPQDENLVLFH